MDKLFLDANILFSAAYHKNAGLKVLWNLENVLLCSSMYAVEEADRNLSEPAQQKQLKKLLMHLELVKERVNNIILPTNLSLREKDKPILQAAIHSQSNYLITGDYRDFGKFFGKLIENVMILPPADYLRLINFKI